MAFYLRERWKQAGKFHLCKADDQSRIYAPGTDIGHDRNLGNYLEVFFYYFLRASMLSGKNILNRICWKTPGALNTPATLLPPYTSPQGRLCVWYCKIQHVHPPLWTSAVHWMSPCIERKSGFADGAFSIAGVGIAHAWTATIVYVMLVGVTWPCLTQQVHVGLEWTVGWLHWVQPVTGLFSSAPVSYDSWVWICIHQDHLYLHSIAL